MPEAAHAGFGFRARGVGGAVAFDDFSGHVRTHVAHDGGFGRIAVQDARAKEPDDVKEVVEEPNIIRPRGEESVEEEDARA